VSVCGWSPSAASTASTSRSSTARSLGHPPAVVEGSVDVRAEYVVRVTGTCRRARGHGQRPLGDGEIELTDCRVEVLAVADPPPFQLDDRVEIDAGAAALSLLDLRRENMQANLRLAPR